MSDRVSKKWSASAYWFEFRVENVSFKNISIIDVKSLSYTTKKKRSNYCPNAQGAKASLEAIYVALAFAFLSPHFANVN
jgi:hypothetical protein